MHACKLMVCVCVCRARALRDTICGVSDLQALVSIAQSNDERIKPVCAHALHSFSMLVDKETVFVKEGAVLALMILALFRSDDTLTKSMCACALFNLMKNNECRAALVDEGVVWALVKLSESDKYVLSTVHWYVRRSHACSPALRCCSRCALVPCATSCVIPSTKLRSLRIRG